MSEIPEVAADALAAEPKQEQARQPVEAAEVQAEAAAPVAEPIIEVEPVAAEPVKTPKQKKEKKRRPVGVRIVMAFLAVILCVAIFAVSFAGVLILNIRTVTSRDGISKIVNQLVAGPSASGVMRPALAAGTGTVYLDESSAAESDMSGILVDWAYDLFQEEFGDELKITKEQVETFVQESTVKDFVAEKAAGLVEDFYNEESNTTITVEEITQLIQENKEIIEEQFGVVLDAKAIENVDTALKESGILEPIEDQGLMGYIEQSLVEKPDMEDSDSVGGGSNSSSGNNSSSGSSGGMTDMQESLAEAKQIMSLVRQVTSYKAVALLAGVFVMLVIALFFVTGRSFPATLSQTGSMLLVTGVIFLIPTVLCQVAPGLVTGILGKELGGILCLVFQTAAGLNYTVVAVAFALIVGAIVVKIIKGVRARNAQ